MGTNEKVQAILDEALRSQITDNGQKETRRMRRRLRLYGCGSGAPLPRVVKDKRPYTAYPRYFSKEEDIKICQKIKECKDAKNYEHEAWYRTTRGKDETGKEDPEKLFIGSFDRRQQANNGYNNQRNKWYSGHCPSGPVSTLAFADASRYGPRGVANERQYRKYPNSTDQYIIDEWVPPLSNVPPGNSALFTPRLWPENANYVSGFKKEQKASSYWYRSQTTATDDIAENKLSTKLQRVLLLEESQATELKNAARSTVEDEHSPQFSIGCEDDLGERLGIHDNESSAQETSMLSRSMRYVGPQTLIVSSGARPLVVQNMSAPQRLELRWHEVACLYKYIKSDRKHRSPLRVFEDLASQFRNCRSEFNRDQIFDEAYLPRHVFVEALHSQVEHCSRGAANLLCTLLDEGERGTVEYVQLLGMILVLIRLDLAPSIMLLELWTLHYQHGAKTRCTARRLEAVMNTCVQFPDDIEANRTLANTAHAALVASVVMRSSSSFQTSQSISQNSADSARSSILKWNQRRLQQPDGIFEKWPATVNDVSQAFESVDVSIFADQLRAVRSLVATDELAPQPTKQDRKEARDNNIRRRVSLSRTESERCIYQLASRPGTSQSVLRPSTILDYDTQTCSPQAIRCGSNSVATRPATSQPIRRRSSLSGSDLPSASRSCSIFLTARPKSSISTRL